MWCGAAPLLYGDTRYATRNLIGHIDGLSTFPHDESLRDFYGRWYRPDLQAVIVVGDFDVDEMEAKVRAAASDIPAKGEPRAEAADNAARQCAAGQGLFTDPEATMTLFSLYYKRPLRLGVPQYAAGEPEHPCDGMMMYAMNLRLAELAMRPGASFVSAYVAGDPVASFVSDVMRLTVNVKEGEPVAGGDRTVYRNGEGIPVRIY